MKVKAKVLKARFKDPNNIVNSKEYKQALSDRADKNSQLLDKVSHYLQQGEEYKKENIILKKWKAMWEEFYYDLLSKDKRDYRVRELMRHINHKYIPEEEFKNFDKNLKMVINCLAGIDSKKAFKEPKKEK